MGRKRDQGRWGGRDRFGPRRHSRVELEESADDEYLDDGLGDDLEDPYDDEYVDEPPRRTRGRAGREQTGRRRSPRRRKEGSRRRRELDFRGLEELEEGADDDPYRGEEVEARRGAGATPRRKRVRRESQRPARLVDLCTPLFGFAALLPREEATGLQPGYDAFRQQVLAALNRLEEDAAKQGIAAEDAREAAYALCAFLDESVARSGWEGRSQWLSEPLCPLKYGDMNSGESFFEHVDRLGDRQAPVMEVYLVCLAFGFVGRYADLPLDQQVEQLGQYRQRLLRRLHPRPMDQLDTLFPWAYREAEPIDEPGAAPPRWWFLTAAGAVVVTLLLWLGMFYLAGRAPNEALEAVQAELDRDVPEIRTGPPDLRNAESPPRVEEGSP